MELLYLYIKANFTEGLQTCLEMQTIILFLRNWFNNFNFLLITSKRRTIEPTNLFILVIYLLITFPYKMSLNSKIEIQIVLVFLFKILETTLFHHKIFLMKNKALLRKWEMLVPQCTLRFIKRI